MEHIAESRLQELAARLEQQTQHSVMQYIGQFSQAEICSAFGCPPPGAVDTLHPLVFNMERGVHLDAQIEFLQACPDVQPFDLLLANELDDGCVRSGGRHVAAELARALGMYYMSRCSRTASRRAMPGAPHRAAGSRPGANRCRTGKRCRCGWTGSCPAACGRARAASYRHGRRTAALPRRTARWRR